MDDKLHHYTRNFIEQCERVSPTDYKECVERFQRMFDSNDDEFRWKVLRMHKYIGYKVMLDNDQTLVVFNQELTEKYGIKDWHGAFDDYIGNSSGVVALLNSLDIPNERY